MNEEDKDALHRYVVKRFIAAGNVHDSVPHAATFATCKEEPCKGAWLLLEYRRRIVTKRKDQE